MNPFTQGSWLWRAWRGQSLTFAALFALSVLGVSVLGWLRALLERLDAPWYVWLLAPIVLVALLAKKEAQWWPDPGRRSRWARGLVIGSIVLALLIARLAPETEAPQTLEKSAAPLGRAGVKPAGR